MRLTRIRQDETGSALVIALVVVLITLGLGFAALSSSDVQTHQTGVQLRGEAAFNLAESALDAQSRLLQLQWASTTANTAACTQASAPSSTCPGSTVTNAFNQTYAGKQFASPTWTTTVPERRATGPLIEGAPQGVRA